MPRSSQTVEDTSKSTNADTPGAPGTDSNIPGYEAVSQTGTSETTHNEKIVNNEINTYEEVKEQAPGGIKRLSVAVVVDKQIDSKQQAQIEEIVKGAAGFDEDRGDQISVAGMPFNTEYQDKIQSEMAQAEKQQQMLIYGGLAALALLTIGGVTAGVAMKKRRAKEAAMEDGMGEIIPLPIRELEQLPSLEKEISPEDKERKLRKDQVEKVAKEHPDDIAQLLRTWLAEE